MAFDDRQLDDIRARLKVSEVVGARFPLVKKGTEYVAKGNESFTVNDKKAFWCEFGAGGDSKPHDIFAFLEIYEGYSFVDAVKELAGRAGINLSDGERSGARSGASNGHAYDRGSSSAGGDRGGDRDHGRATDAPAHDSSGDRPVSVSGKKEVVATWDYVDPENVLLYQVVRMQERLPDGGWKTTREGKTWKTFMQRRPAPDGNWILGLDVLDRESGAPLEFVKTERSTFWLRATDERLQWRGITTAQFGELGNVDHWLYGANDVLDELQEPKEDQRTIFMPEGEGKVDVLKEWGLLGVTNSGGAKNFTPASAEFFRNARHVVLLQDNDRAGAERVAKVAPMLKAVGVGSIQVLNFLDVWPKCPMKGDIKDWREKANGTRDALLEIVDGLKEWAPEPYKSKFGAKTSRDLTAKVSAYPWRIKYLVPMNDDVLIMGPSRSGKTFEAMDMLMHCHFEMPFAGKKVIPCGSVYCTYEGATGFENRLRGYLKHHNLTEDALHSFAWITRPPGLYASEENVKELAAEIREISKDFKMPLGFVVVDTHNSATRGSSEIKSEDMDKVLSRYQLLREETNVPNWIIGHTNADGKHRGNEQFFNGIETALLVQRVQEHKTGKTVVDLRDDEGRVRRKVSINKQREGDDRTSWEFVLHPVVIGTDDDGDPITSMVSVPPSSYVPENASAEVAKTSRPDGQWLNDTQVSQFKALLAAIADVGAPPPPELKLPSSVDRVVTTTQFGSEWRKRVPRGEDDTYQKYQGRTKASLHRFQEKLGNAGVIAIDKIDKSTTTEKNIVHYIWPTGRRVFGRTLQYPKLPPKKKDPDPILAPGETTDDLKDVF